MYDIPELEKKWKKYQRNKIKKPLKFIFIVAFLGGASYFALEKYQEYQKYSQKQKKEEQKVTTNTPTTQTTTQNVIQKAPQNTQNNDKAIIIQKIPMTQAASQPRAKRRDDDMGIDLSNATIVKPNVPDEEIRVIGFDKKEKEKVLKKYGDILDITPSSTNIDPIVEEYTQRFEDNKDPLDALYLAKYFYKKGKYEQAEIWAANANNIDGELEDSWIIFAKAKAKQGHRVEAIKILQEYYDSTKSLRAKKLLGKLRRNKPF